MGRGSVGLSVVLGLAAILCSCAALGTKVEVRSPELVKSIKVVGLAPIFVDQHTLSVCEEAEGVVLAALVARIEESGAFDVVGADSLLSHVPGEDAVDAEALLDSARRLGLDGVLFCKLEAFEFSIKTKESVGWGVSFDSAGKHVYRVKESVKTRPSWCGPKVSLQMVESGTGRLVLSTQFNTVSGKSYMTVPPVEKQIADAVEGAFKPLAEAWAKPDGKAE